MVRVHAEVAAGVAAAIRGGDVRLTTNSVDIAIRDGVAPLLAASPAASSLDTGARQRLTAHAQGAAIQAAALDDELRRLLAALAAGGAHPVLVIKGAHLAHAVYPAPHLRPRSDTDLLIAAADRRAITAALERAGYLPAALVNGRILLGQFLYHRTLGPGMVHDVDVHWRAAAPLVFSDAVDTAAVYRDGMALPAFGPTARGPSLPDALALACVHVVAHHWPDGSLRWWHDLFLLAGRLDDDGRHRFAAAATRGRYCSVAIAAIARARSVFPSPALDAALDRLRSAGAVDEPSAALTSPHRRGIEDFLLDLRVAGWRSGTALVREHLLPPPTYMRLAFAGRPLPMAYVERLVRAVTKRTIGRSGDRVIG
jgi:hypothetical protein